MNNLAAEYTVCSTHTHTHTHTQKRGHNKINNIHNIIFLVLSMTDHTVRDYDCILPLSTSCSLCPQQASQLVVFLCLLGWPKASFLKGLSHLLSWPDWVAAVSNYLSLIIGCTIPSLVLNDPQVICCMSDTLFLAATLRQQPGLPLVLRSNYPSKYSASHLCLLNSHCQGHSSVKFHVGQNIFTFF